MRVLVVSAASLALAGVAAGSGSGRSVTAPAPVAALAFDGPSIAYATGDGADCDRIRIWSLKTGRSTKLGRKTHCEVTSTGRGIDSIAIAGARALWLHYAGGNIREWSLWTATTTRPEARQLRFVARDVEEPAPIVVGDGDSSRLGDILPYAVGRTVIALRANGARRFSWTAPGRVVALSALDGELAVATAGGIVTVLDAGGNVLATEGFGGTVDALKLTGSALLVQQGRTLELRNGARPARIWTLPAGARLTDSTGDVALYLLRGRVHRLGLARGEGRVVARGTLAQVEGSRVAVASGRSVTVRDL